MRKVTVLIAAVVTALLLASACGDGKEPAATPTPTAMPMATPTPMSAPAATPEGAPSITFEVTFDGDRCQYKGPEAIGEGEVVIVLNNLTDSRAVHLHVLKLDEGKTQQDLVEYVGDAIDKPPPPWVSLIVGIFGRGVVEGIPNAERYLFRPGSHAIVCAEHLTFPIRVAAPLIEVRPNSSE